jgi:hypothetical protein
MTVSKSNTPSGATGEIGAGSPAGSQPQKIILVIKDFGRRLSEKGRLQVTFFNNESYSLDASRIKHIYYLNNTFYFVYETDNPQFYDKYSVSSFPALATSLKFEVKEYTEERCTYCNSIIEWDADEPYCPRCGPDFPGFHEIKVKKLIIREDFEDELKEFAKKLINAEVEHVATLYTCAAGGYTPLFKLSPVNVMLYTTQIEGAAIVENPVFTESHYDEIEEKRHEFIGKYLILETRDRDLRSIGFYYVLFRLNDEPKLGILEQLIKEEEERRRKEEEERKRKAEERKRREEEEKKKWGDPNEVAKEIVSKLPEWADGAYVKQKAIWGEDADIITYVLPVKRSQRGSGFYTSESWNRVTVSIKSQYLEPLAGEVILRDGTRVKVRENPPKNGGKYIDLLLNS